MSTTRTQPPDGCMDYESEGHLYALRPIWTGEGLRTKVHNCEMYDNDGTFLGYIDPRQLGLKTMYQLEKQARWLQALGFKCTGDNVQPPLIEDWLFQP